MKNDCLRLSSSESNEADLLADPQDGSDKNKAEQGINGCAAAVYDAWNKATGLCRQAEVITHGIVEGGTKEFAHEIAKRPLETGINGGLSLGVGIGLSYLQLRHKLAHKVVGAIVGLFGVKAAIDGFKHLNENRDFTSAMDLAWSRGNKATMDRSKALATKVLAPEVVQFEVGALAGGLGYSGGLGFAALKNKSFAEPWSKLMAKASECLKSNPLQKHQSVTEWPLCDPNGNPFAVATKVEKKIIEEFVTKLQAAKLEANPKFSHAIRRSDNRILELEFKTIPSKERPSFMHRDDQAAMYEIAEKLEAEIFDKYAVKVSFGQSEVYSSALQSGNVILKHDFLKPEAVNPQWLMTLLEHKEIEGWEVEFDDAGLARPIM